MARDDIREVRKEVRDLRKRVQMRPIVTSGPARQVSVGVLSSFGGNVITTINAVDILGIKKISTNVTNVATVLPVLATTYADGLGYAYLTLNGNTSIVWVALRVNGTYGTVLSYPQNFVCRTLASSIVTVTASSDTATVYLPYVA